MQKNPLPSPWLCYTVRVSLFIDFGWAWSWKGEKRKGILCKSTAVSTPGVNTPLHHIPEGWNTCPKKDKAGSTQALPYPPCSSKEDWLLTMLSWRMNLHTGLQQEHQATVDTQPSSIIHYPTLSCPPHGGRFKAALMDERSPLSQKQVRLSIAQLKLCYTTYKQYFWNKYYKNLLTQTHFH